jgi:GTPase involved in cell partitioning and DNA repair
MLRRDMAALALVPILGVQKTGKSTLLQTLTGRDFGAGARNTRMPQAITVGFAGTSTGSSPSSSPSRVTLVDFPGCNDGLDVYLGLGLNLLRVSASAVLVLTLENADDTTSQELVKCASSSGSPRRILVCINKLDVVFESARQKFLNDNAAQQRRSSYHGPHGQPN